MANFTITNRKGDDTVPSPPENQFEISTLYGSKCDPVVYRNVDNVAYFKRPEGAENSNAGGKSASPDINPIVGDTIYSDEAMTTLYVTNFPTLEQKLDFNINKGDFITIGPGSIIINTSCK